MIGRPRRSGGFMSRLRDSIGSALDASFNDPNSSRLKSMMGRGLGVVPDQDEKAARVEAGRTGRGEHTISESGGESPFEVPAPPGHRGAYDAVMSRAQGLMETILWRVAIGGLVFAFSAGVAAGILIGLIFAGWEVGWLGGTILVNRWNLARPRLGVVRWLLFAGYVIGYPLVTVTVILRILFASYS
jgi:hypothetical protein